jgi:hypothetical protein
VETPEGNRFAQYGCLNFHSKRDETPKLSLTIKNKWSARWMKAWFYCQVPYRWSSEGGKSIHALHSPMSKSDYTVESKVECPDSYPNVAAFVWATATIRGYNAVEEYIACKVYPLAASFIFESVPLGMTPTLKVEVPLPLFVVESVSLEHANHVLAEVEMEAERVLGSFGPKEHDALGMTNILNDGRLNQVLEQMGVPYAPHPLPGSKASQATIKKRNAEMSKKPVVKRAKTGHVRAMPSKMVPPPPKSRPAKKISILKITRPKAKPGL